MRLLICTLAVLLVPAAASAAIIKVPGDYTTIQAAIDAAAIGDEIVVEPGTYVENIIVNGKEVTVRSRLGAAATTIDGSIPLNPPYGSVATFIQSPGANLEGFTLTNGTGMANGGDSRGGGIYSSNSHVGVRNCLITGNTVTVLGGGIYSSNGTVHADSCVIRNNYSGDAGGGVASYYHSIDICINCVIHDNTAAQEGGGAYCRFESWCRFIACTFYGNGAVSGGGLATDFLAQANLESSILWANTPQQVYVGEDKGYTTVSVKYCDVQGGQAGVFKAQSSHLNWGAGNIDRDPGFADAGTRDLHLRYDSPCRDAGEATGTGVHDFEGDPRRTSGGTDMGADEFYPHLYHRGDLSPGGSFKVIVTGVPGVTPVFVALGSGIQDPPQTTPYGKLHIKLPIWWYKNIGTIPASGILSLQATTPSGWQPGTVWATQALFGIVPPFIMLSNLDLLVVQ